MKLQNNVYTKTYLVLRERADYVYNRYIEGLGPTKEEVEELETIVAVYASQNEGRIFEDGFNQLPPRQEQFDTRLWEIQKWRT